MQSEHEHVYPAWLYSYTLPTGHIRIWPYVLTYRSLSLLSLTLQLDPNLSNHVPNARLLNLGFCVSDGIANL